MGSSAKTKKSKFFYRQNEQDAIKKIEADLPLSLKGKQNLIDIVHERSGELSKEEIKLIILTTFRAIRIILLQSKTLNISEGFDGLAIQVYPVNKMIFVKSFARCSKFFKNKFLK